MTDRKETQEERIRREMDEAERAAAIIAWKRNVIFSLLLTFWTAVIISLFITILRSP